VYARHVLGYDARMLEQGRETARSESNVNVGAKTQLKRTARGTAPPAGQLAESEMMVECRTCKTRVPFASANILATHCVCASCSADDMRATAAKSLPANAENIRLPHQFGAPLIMFAMTAIGTAALVIAYSL
jgi:hypothetical protein